MERGIVAGALFLSTFLPPAPNQVPNQKSQTPKEEAKIYVVKKGDSLQSIAKAEYGSEDYWTNLVDDNEIIKDPNIIEKDWKLKIETKKTDQPKEIKRETQVAQIAQTTPTPATQAVNQPTPTVATPSQAVTPVSQQPATTPNSLNEAQINFLGTCESGMTAGRNSGNGYYGAFQFSLGTWNRMGTGYERADLAPLDVQKDAVQRLVAGSSVFGQFPGCAAKMRSLGLL